VVAALLKRKTEGKVENYILLAPGTISKIQGFDYPSFPGRKIRFAKGETQVSPQQYQSRIEPDSCSRSNGQFVVKIFLQLPGFAKQQSVLCPYISYIHKSGSCKLSKDGKPQFRIEL